MADSFYMAGAKGKQIFVRKWGSEHPKSVIVIMHGMNEHSKRYSSLAECLNQRGHTVFAADLRGHGKTADSIEKIGFLDEHGFQHIMEDICILIENVQKEYPKKPVFLIAHSMGSFIAQRFIQLYGNRIDGAVLVGSGGKRPDAKAGAFMASVLKKWNGDKRSTFLEKLIFFGYNARFEKRTSYDWLSRDQRIVDDYISDPYCAHVFPPSFYVQFLTLIQQIAEPKNVNKVSNALPLLIISGSQDPVGKYGKSVSKLVRQYEKHGMEDLKYTLYPNGRHEILNELNKDEVMEDISNWLDMHRVDEQTVKKNT
ncbi:alpha/beta hydrolase [Bacillus sp. 1P06AnD]|uniref:alpha/beta hydrolase n=1 Tax=Bacillus sp. 1P06AnD TaxID=3132208 RepID=UPI0039A1E90E